MYPLTKAVKDIPVGQKVTQMGPDTYDYSHVLEPIHQEAVPGAQVHVNFIKGGGAGDDQTGWLQARIRDGNGETLGRIEADLFPRESDGRKVMRMGVAEVRKAPQVHNGRRLYFGRRLYEAMMAHAKNALGATHIEGDAHSSYASAAHRWLAEKHGMNYDPFRNIVGEYNLQDAEEKGLRGGNPYTSSEDWAGPPESFDDRYAPYSYTLKSERELSLGDMSAPPQNEDSDHTQYESGFFADSNSTKIFDYTHILSPEQQAKGYKLELHEDHHPIPGAFKKLTGWILHHNHLRSVGKVEAYMEEPTKVLHMDYSRMDQDHRAQHLGRAAYEAVLAHARGHHGAISVRGGKHSTTAHATHKAIVDKYGLQWIYDHPTVGENQALDTGRGSFDNTHGTYAYTLHRYASVSDIEIPLAKEVDEHGFETDAQKLLEMCKQDYMGYGQFDMIYNNPRCSQEHLTALMLNPGVPGSRKSTLLHHSGFTQEVWNKTFRNTPTGEYDPVAVTSHNLSSLFSALFDASYGGSGPEWSRDTRFRIDNLRAIRKAIGDATHINDEKKNDLTDMFKRFEATYYADASISNTLTEDDWAQVPLEYGGHDDMQTIRPRIISRMFSKYINAEGNPKLPGPVLNKALEYAKDLLGHVEKLKGGTTLSRRVNMETERALPQLVALVQHNSIPEQFLKGRMKKGLFQAVLAASPDYPKKKFEAMFSHFMDKKLPGANVAIQKKLLEIFSQSPHMSTDRWPDLVQAFGHLMNMDQIIADPRFNDDLALKLLANKNVGTDYLMRVLSSAQKLTPTVAHKAMESLFPQDPAARLAEASERFVQLEAAGQHKRAEDGTLRNDWGELAEAYNVNPYGFSHERVQEVIGGIAYDATVAAQILTPQIVSMLFDKYEQMEKFKWPGQEALQNKSSRKEIVGLDRYSVTSFLDAPFYYRTKMGDMPQPELDERLTKMMIDPTRSIGDNVEPATGEWLQRFVPLEHVPNIISQTKNSGVISTLLSRSDVKPEWVDLALSRPELNPEHASRLEADPNRIRYHERPTDFARRVNYAVLHSNGLDEPRMMKVLDNITDPSQAQEIAENQNLTPAAISKMLSWQPKQSIYAMDEYGNRKVDENGNYVVQSTTGNMPWGIGEHGRMIRNLMSYQVNKLTPEHYNAIIDSPVMKDRDWGYRIGERLTDDTHNTPSDVLEKLLTQITTGNMRGMLSTQSVLNHKNAKAEWLQKIIDEIPSTETDENRVASHVGKLAELLDSTALTPGQLQQMSDKVLSLSGGRYVPAPGNQHPDVVSHDTALGPNYRHTQAFWTKLVRSGKATEQQKNDIWNQMMEFDDRFATGDAQGYIPPNRYFTGNMDRHSYNSELAWHLKKEIESSNPDSMATSQVHVKVGSHALRGVRDLIDSAGGQALHTDLPPVMNWSNLRTTAPMGDEEYLRIPEKNRPKVRPNKKTNFVSSENIQKFIDAMPSMRYGITHTQYHHNDLQMHNGKVPDEVFQVNISNEHIAKLKAAGLWNTFNKIQDAVGAGAGTLHPLLRPSIGWIRHSKVSPQGTVHITEIQSDIRPQGGSWKYTIEQKLKPQLLKMWGGGSRGPFPAEEADAIHEIIFGKRVDPHMAILEAFHQHLRDQGHHNVVIHLPNVGFRGSLPAGLSGWGNLKPTDPIPPPGQQDAPKHYYETYDELPKKLGYAHNAAKYGDEPSQVNDRFKGFPTSTSPVRKFEDFGKAIEDLPDMPTIRAGKYEHVFDASHYLPQHHRAAGYTMRVHSGEGEYGPYSVVDLLWGGRPVGGGTLFVDDEHKATDAEGKPVKYGAVDLANIADEHTGKRLGLPMYEALLASAKKYHGCTRIRGQVHSTLAHSVHKQLAEKHGLRYEAEPNHPSMKYPNTDAWEQQAPAPMDARYGPYDYTLKSELAKSFKAEVPKKVRLTDEADAYDYSHMLPQGERAKYKLILVHSPKKGKLDAHIYHNATGNEVGVIQGMHYNHNKRVQAIDSYIDNDHRSKGLGKAMYGALYSHAMNALGATHAAGDVHSSSAHAVHAALAAEHGLSYKANRNLTDYSGIRDWHDTSDQSYDRKYGSYDYTLR